MARRKISSNRARRLSETRSKRIPGRSIAAAKAPRQQNEGRRAARAARSLKLKQKTKCRDHSCDERVYGYDKLTAGTPTFVKGPKGYDCTKLEAKAIEVATAEAKDRLDKAVEAANTDDNEDCPAGCKCKKDKDFGPVVVVTPNATMTIKDATAFDEKDINKGCHFDVPFTYDWTCKTKTGKCYVGPPVMV